MKINLRRVPVEGETLRGAEPAAIMELDEPDLHFEHEIQYELLAQIQGNALLVTGRLWTPVTLRCGRCLKSFEQRLEVRQFVVHQELQGEEMVDLTPHLREDIILQLPQRALCDEACKGLCPECGADLNVRPCSCRPSHGDLRWAALDQINLHRK